MGHAQTRNLDARVEALGAVLEATEAAARAAEGLDLDAFDQAVTDRGRGLARLAELEARTGGGPAAGPDQAEAEARLKEFTRRVEEADSRARQAVARALAGLRSQVRGVNQTQGGLRGYRGPADTPARFADRRM
ncbi:MAG: hypothetical protein ACYDA8_06430 [Deferrisomatales bacterium]